MLLLRHGNDLTREFIHQRQHHIRPDQGFEDRRHGELDCRVLCPRPYSAGAGIVDVMGVCHLDLAVLHVGVAHDLCPSVVFFRQRKRYTVSIRIRYRYYSRWNVHRSLIIYYINTPFKKTAIFLKAVLGGYKGGPEYLMDGVFGLIKLPVE